MRDGWLEPKARRQIVNQDFLVRIKTGVQQPRRRLRVCANKPRSVVWTILNTAEHGDPIHICAAGPAEKFKRPTSLRGTRSEDELTPKVRKGTLANSGRRTTSGFDLPISSSVS